MMRKSSLVFFVLILVVVLVSGCTEGQPVAEPAATEPEQAVQEEPAAAQDPTEIPPTREEPTTIPPSETPQPAAEPELEALPAEAQEIIFNASDGQELTGRYYPAAVNPAPVIVLMHWAGGDQFDWVEIAYWLQNRGLGGETEPSQPWLDPSWFPALPEDASYAVFTFSFRDCEGGCHAFNSDLWLLDAQAAMETAMNLEGIDAQRMLTAGASIGADGAPDGCLWLNQNHGTHCLGAFSFSPGSYLTLSYADVVTGLETLDQPVPAYCLYSVEDGASAETCRAAGGALYETQEWAGNQHGMVLIQPGLDPNALEMFLAFIQENL